MWGRIDLRAIERTTLLFREKTRVILLLIVFAVLGTHTAAFAGDDQDDSLPAAALPLIKQLPPQEQYYQNIARSGFYSYKDAQQPLRVYLKPGSVKVSPELQSALHSAFDEWTKVSNGRLKFQFVNFDSDPDITVVWSNNPADVKEGKQGYTSFSKTKDNIARSKIILLTNRQNGESLNRRFAKALALHEIGHAIGINGHSYNSDDIMFGGRLQDTSHDWREYTITKNSLLLQNPTAIRRCPFKKNSCRKTIRITQQHSAQLHTPIGA